MIGRSCMSVFTWLKLRSNKANYKNNKSVIEQELRVFRNCTMWPTAKVDPKQNIAPRLFITQPNKKHLLNNQNKSPQARFKKKIA